MTRVKPPHWSAWRGEQREREREDGGFICCHSEKVDYPLRSWCPDVRMRDVSTGTFTCPACKGMSNILFFARGGNGIQRHTKLLACLCIFFIYLIN